MSDTHRFEATVAWPADPAQKRPPDPAFSRNARLASPGHPPIAGSSPTVFGGEADRYNPEELVTMALAHCHMLTYLAVAAKKKIAVLAYEDRATAVLGKDPATGKMKIVSAQLRPRVTVAKGTSVDEALALHAKAHEHCFVSNSVNFPVTNAPEVVEA
ncbi:MAG TPA: OsmC family protein [Usitatibacteraceae bacterium]|nr:OsmC family protein [Usitatibacteraceae bacterium]